MERLLLWLILTPLLAPFGTTVDAQTTDGCLVSKAGLDYVGFQVVTRTSKTCVSWSLTPFGTSDALFPEKNATLARNYCRNPGYSRTSIWCYINATSLDFDFCDSVPICQSSCRQTEAGQEYNGGQQLDANGVNCLSWASVSTISADYFLYDRTLADANAYCRNVPPDPTSPTVLYSVPWCYINQTNPTVSGCSIPFCSQLSVGGCRTDRLGQLYRGTTGVSVTGKSCVAWNSSSVYTASNWPIAGETIVAASSYCRNPNNSTVGLWCFVSSTQWEPCMVPVCEPKTSCPSNTQDYYRYRLSQTKTGCSSWSSVYASSSGAWYSPTQVPPSASALLTTPLFHPAHLPDASLASAGTYCRNPDNDPVGPWCPSGVGGKVYCSDPCNTVTCLTSQSTPNYIGKVSVTRRGVTCQRWTAKYPWYHSFDITGNFPDLSVSDAANFCRNPDGNPFGPWCIKAGNISDGDFWDFCSVPVCAGVTLPGAVSPTNTDECIDSSFGVTYAGTKAVTGSGRSCQRWDAQAPHPHPYYLPQMFNALAISDAANRCRNPNNDTNGPWCFTADSSVRFEYCNVSRCTPNYPSALEGALSCVGVLSVHSIILTAFAAGIFLVQEAIDQSNSSRLERQQAASVEPKIERTASLRPTATPAVTVIPTSDGTLDRRSMYRHDGTSESQQPPSKFSHNNAVMKAMANSEPPPSARSGTTAHVQQDDVWIVGTGEPGLVGTLQPIREEEQLQQQKRQQVKAAKAPAATLPAVEPQPTPPQKPLTRDTETLERRLDFDAESLESASQPNTLRRQQHARLSAHH